MAYGEGLAHRIRRLIAAEPGVTEKRMFGGLAFLINGNMSVSASGKGGILLRVDPAETDVLVARPHDERGVMGGRTRDGWLRVDVDGLPDNEVETWIGRGIAYARSLPAK